MEELFAELAGSRAPDQRAPSGECRPPTDVIDGLDSVGSATRYAGNPGYFSAYGEVGYWLTGETRGYKGGGFNPSNHPGKVRRR